MKKINILENEILEKMLGSDSDYRGASETHIVPNLLLWIGSVLSPECSYEIFDEADFI